MSCSLWRYTTACEGQACPGECDLCSFEPGAPEILRCRECRFATPKSVKVSEPTEWTCTKYNAVRYGGEFCSRGETRMYEVETHTINAGEV